MTKAYTRYKIDPYKKGIMDQKTGMLVCEEHHAEQYFDKKTNTIKRKVAELDAEIARLVEERSVLRAKCKHTNAVYKYCADTGNYDPSSDCYWIEYRCYDCGKYWTEDQ